MPDRLPLVYHPDYVCPLPEGHRFPMPKFGMVNEILRAEGIAGDDNTFQPDIADETLLSCVHTPVYVHAFLTGALTDAEQRRTGLPWSEALARRTCTAVGGTLLTSRLALEHGIACNMAGGTHHAHPGFGSGFCIFNDLAVAARTLVREGAAATVLILDLDVHQGDGTAAAFQNDPAVFTFSMHCQSNFPFRKTAGDMDIGLPDGMNGEAYLSRLKHELPGLLDAARPDLVLYDAGVDVFSGDRLGKLDLSLADIAARDAMVIAFFRERGIPLAGVIGGGYDRDVHALADRHCTLHRSACRVHGIEALGASA
ncbi:MAG: histone deacetylase [bacterium]